MTFAQVTSEQVVLAYIERIKEVNPILNAVVEDRFEAALEDARRADRLVQTTSEFLLVTNYPILGVPFTVKESCSLKGMYRTINFITYVLITPIVRAWPLPIPFFFLFNSLL